MLGWQPWLPYSTPRSTTLDHAVESAYGWLESPKGTGDETILARLLALNLERANAS